MCQQRVDIVYKDKLVGGGRTDILVGNKLVVELKAVAALAEEHVAQVLINLRLRHLRLGLRLNFNGITMKGQFRRVVLDPQYL